MSDDRGLQGLCRHAMQGLKGTQNYVSLSSSLARLGKCMGHWRKKGTYDESQHDMGYVLPRGIPGQLRNMGARLLQSAAM